MDKINKTLEIHAKQLQNIQLTLDRMKFAPPPYYGATYSFGLTYKMLIKSMIFIVLGILVSYIFKQIYK